MTKIKKKKSKNKGHRSLYLGFFYNILVGVLLAVLVFGAIYLPAWYIIDNHYSASDMQKTRREEYLNNLQDYVQKKSITMDTTDEIGGWVRDNPYVYLLVYQKSNQGELTSYPLVAPGKPSEKDKLRELPGSRIDEKLDRDQLIADAQKNGYYTIKLKDGNVTVALSEYTENLYYSVFTFVSILAAVLTFVLALVRYIRVLIERIKRFESDVTIVSEIDMNYAIISEGQDEISNLSTRVEGMRCTMLDHIRSEQEAREANTELITSISHDIRTPLTVLMGYIEMMKDHAQDDMLMQSYIDASESTALRLKQLSDDMFKYSLAFGDTKKSVKLEEYDFITLYEQIFAEHILLMREYGYDIQTSATGDEVKEGTTVYTDAPNLMRIVDNIFSNLGKYADKSHPVSITMHAENSVMTLECRNKIRIDTEGAESNGIGLKTCVRLGSLVARKFEYSTDDDIFICRLVLDIKPPVENEE